MLDELLEYKPADTAIRAKRADLFEAAGSIEDALKEIDAALVLDSQDGAAIQRRNRPLSRKAGLSNKPVQIG